MILFSTFPRDGNLLDIEKAGSLHEYVVHLHKTYGPVVSFWWGKTYTVSVACPKLWKDIQSIFDRPCKLV
jgi:cytochrome P450 family 20 subfamily A